MDLSLPQIALMMVSAHALAVMSPGPDFFVTMRNTLTHGRAAGIATAWGVALGMACT